MSLTFGGTTGDDVTMSSMVSIASDGWILMGWFYPTNLTAGKALWGASSLTHVKIHTATTELALALDRTTDSLHLTSGLGLIINKWHFICIVRCSVSGVPAWRVWVAVDGAPPSEVSVTTSVAGSGSIVASTFGSIGNDSGAGTNAFLGDIGQVTDIRFTPSVISPIEIETGGTITQAEADYFLETVVKPYWLGQPRPHLVRGTTITAVMFDLEQSIPCAHIDQRGGSTRTTPEALTVNGAVINQNKQAGKILQAWPTRQQLCRIGRR